MTDWLLIVMLGTTISTSTVSEIQCRVALVATQRMGERFSLPAAAICVSPSGEVLRNNNAGLTVK